MDNLDEEEGEFDVIYEDDLGEEIIEEEVGEYVGEEDVEEYGEEEIEEYIEGEDDESLDEPFISIDAHKGINL